MENIKEKFENWIQKLKEIYLENHFHRSVAETFDENELKNLFEQNLTPEEVFKRDVDHIIH
jgi:hypothetical protein